MLEKKDVKRVLWKAYRLSGYEPGLRFKFYLLFLQVER